MKKKKLSESWSPEKDDREHKVHEVQWMKGNKPTWYKYIRNWKGVWERYRDWECIVYPEERPQGDEIHDREIKGKESIKEKSSGRESAKCDMERQAK